MSCLHSLNPPDPCPVCVVAERARVMFLEQKRLRKILPEKTAAQRAEKAQALKEVGATWWEEVKPLFDAAYTTHKREEEALIKASLERLDALRKNHTE